MDSLTAAIIFLALTILILLIVIANFFPLWLRGILSGAHVPLVQLIGMRLRKVSPGLIVQARIMVVKGGLDIETDRLEAHYLAGGNVLEVVASLVAAKKADIALTFEEAAAMDLEGRDIVQVVKNLIKEKGIRTSQGQA